MEKNELLQPLTQPLLDLWFWNEHQSWPPEYVLGFGQNDVMYTFDTDCISKPVSLKFGTYIHLL